MLEVYFTMFYFSLTVANIGFVEESITIGEERPFEIDVALTNDIVPGRSVTVSVAEQS